MSQLGSKAGPEPSGPARHSPGPGTFEGVAGFRIGRGRDNGAPHTRPQQPPYGQQAPQGPSYGGYPAPPQPQPYPGQQQGYGGGHQGGGYDEPEYFGGDGGYGQPPAGPDPYAANHPGHTQAFSVGEDPYNQGGTYRAGSTPPAGPVGPRLHWKDLLRGIVMAPNQTFLQMRDYTMWVPALIVTFLYGLLAVFGFDGAREEAINATLSNAVPIVLTTAVAMVLSSFVLGVVTHTLARQLGGDGAWQPTVGLSMLIMSLTDAPRLVFAMFFGGDATFVQALGWATWVAAGALLTLMVSRSHDLPWPKALGASAIQLIALLSIVKLGTF
ncbi:Yip1 family protein [Streptomyces justiciae]|uniref:Yip1 family protein n=1 Tax=Streptomyces justiciae TaxID=2780140 RepID=A0ABU3M4H2_9ACTN|nr:Yip1 family protein [Streptomyces justiciae]MBE8471234.1 YIP1 family protein [Streptomyces justiciae]MCW8377028.1 YIP1 family protein [Streptomyces justiciae]MDT7846390.1 Yip1 family protein [Streptomyces justiciae]